MSLSLWCLIRPEYIRFSVYGISWVLSLCVHRFLNFSITTKSPKRTQSVTACIGYMVNLILTNICVEKPVLIGIPKAFLGHSFVAYNDAQSCCSKWFTRLIIRRSRVSRKYFSVIHINFVRVTCPIFMVTKHTAEATYFKLLYLITGMAERERAKKVSSRNLFNKTRRGQRERERERERERGGGCSSFGNHRTVTLLTQVQFPGVARDLSHRVNFQCRLSYVCPYTPVCNRIH